MNTDQENEGDSSNPPIGFWQKVKKIALGNAAFGWGFATGFFVNAHLLGVGKPGLLWRLF